MASSSSHKSSFFHTHVHHFTTTSDTNNADMEFNESDLYSDSLSSTTNKPWRASTTIGGSSRMKGLSAAGGGSSRSAPLNIPVWSARLQQNESECSEGDEDDGDWEMRVPPHEYLANKRGASLSVHEGVGRTLKGRDKSRVRDSVWKRIGFED